MTVTEAVDEMKRLFLNSWTAAGYSAANIRWNDVPGSVPTADVVWCRVTVKHAEGNKRVLSAGANTHENTGTFWVQIFAPIGSGDTKGYPAAQAVVNMFRNSNTDVWFRNARLKEVGTSGAFEQTNVLADFTYDN